MLQKYHRTAPKGTRAGPGDILVKKCVRNKFHSCSFLYLLFIWITRFLFLWKCRQAITILPPKPYKADLRIEIAIMHSDTITSI